MFATRARSRTPMGRVKFSRQKASTLATYIGVAGAERSSHSVLATPSFDSSVVFNMFKTPSTTGTLTNEPHTQLAIGVGSTAINKLKLNPSSY
jgi:hypothetical protein